jgi:enoyl-CoA hydratase/carnithine racemase
MKTDDFRDITYQKDTDGIVTLTFNTPRRKNAVSPLSFLEVFWAVDHYEKDDSAFAMIITGAKDPRSDDPAKEAYSSGGYFAPDALEGLSDEVMQQIDMTDIAQKKTTLKLYQCYKPVIGAINGLAIGGAFTLSLAGCDQIYMSEHAWIQLPFARLGIAAELASTFLLPRALGFQKAKEVMFFSERIDANMAVDLGLANSVVPHDELLAYAREKALQIIPPRGAGMAIREMKRIMHQPHIEAVSQALDLENEALNKLMASEDFVEGITARIERRAAEFKGK